MSTRVVHHGSLTYIQTSGGPEEIGYAIGRAATRQIARGVAMMCARWQPKHWLDVRARVGPYREALERYMPECAAELRGMARGAGVPYDLLIAANAGQELGAGRVAGGEGCSCVGLPPAMTAAGGVLLGHNEDSGAGYEETCYVVHARPDRGPAYLAFTYAGLLLHQGLNSAGIGQVGNALYFSDIKAQGTPKLPAYRAALGAGFLEEAIRTAAAPWRANGQNHLLAERSGLMCDVEVSATRHAVIWSCGRTLVHTNHAQTASLAQLERADLLNSQLRQARLEQLLAAAPPAGGHTPATVLAMLSDHANYPKSVCKHLAAPANPHVRTIAAVAVDLTAGELHVAVGYPCEAAPVVFQL